MKHLYVWQRTVQFIVMLLACTALTACGRKTETIIVSEDSTAESSSGQEAMSFADAAADTEEDKVAVLYVHVCGAVLSEGVYALTEGQRIADAVSLAGGMTEDADTAAINLAMRVEDGMMIRVPLRTEEAAGQESATVQVGVTPVQQTGVKAEAAGVININTAGVEELKTLHGIGQRYAEAIITYREHSGGFKSVEDIKNVKGIGDKTFERIRGSITV